MLRAMSDSELAAVGHLHALGPGVFQLANELAEIPEWKFERRIKNLRITFHFNEPTEAKFVELEASLRVFRAYQQRQKPVESPLFDNDTVARML